MILSERFEKSLIQNELLLPGETVYAACSGGPDSVALFFLLRELQASWNLKLGLLHLNHGLRGREAERDFEFVKRLARRFEVPFFGKKIRLSVRAKRRHESLEEAARGARYDFFLEAAKKRRIPKIALAHTEDDQAETVLMRILQGTGKQGLSGIRRVMTMQKVVFIRPLLDFSKSELLDYLKRRRISYRVDRSNDSLRFVRNRIRKKLLPWIQKELNPRVKKALSRLPAIVQEENEALRVFEEEACRKTIRQLRKGKIFLDRKQFLALPPPLQFRILNRALQKIDRRSGVNFETWRRLRPELARKRYRHSLPRDLDLDLSPDKLVIYKKSV